MSQLEGLLNELYRSTHDEHSRQLAERYAPIVCFDAHEPLLPLVAGITLFESDGPSPSMQRTIPLAPPGKPAAAAAIEYAIWWDWDIHHLYELEHVWVYLDGQGQVVRVEGSWHGKFNELALQMDGDHPLVLSEPGKHAFADRPEPFLRRAAEKRRSECKSVGALSHVLINEMFDGQVRSRPYDDSLARAYLVTQAFEPAWDFSQRFHFPSGGLVPWPVLAAWIPQRVNACLEDLDARLSPEDYRALRLVDSSGSPAGLQAALAAGADGVVLPVIRGIDGKPAAGHPRAPGEAWNLEEVFKFCRSVPMRAVLELHEESCIDELAKFLNEKKLYNLAPVTAADPGWLAKLKALAPHAWVIAQLSDTHQDPAATAAACQAGAVLPRGEAFAGQGLAAAWIEQVHTAGLQVLSWPAGEEEARALERRRVDMVWIKS